MKRKCHYKKIVNAGKCVQQKILIEELRDCLDYKRQSSGFLQDGMVQPNVMLSSWIFRAGCNDFGLNASTKKHFF